MSGIPHSGAYTEPWELSLQNGWETYRQAIGLLDRDEWAPALRLLAAAETTFRTADDHEGLWRSLSGQAAAHWVAGDASLAVARATAALRAAEGGTDTLGSGLTAWQLAVMLLGQGDFRRAAELLLQAEELLGRKIDALPQGEIGASAWLCSEITRWQQMVAQGRMEPRTASEVVEAMKRDLLARLAHAAVALRALWGQNAPKLSSERLLLLPAAMPLAIESEAPTRRIGTRVARWWRRITEGEAPTQAGPVMLAAPTALHLPPVPPVFARAAPALELPPEVTAEPTVTILPPPTFEPEAAPPVAAPAPLAVSARRGTRLVITSFGPFRVLIDDRPVERWESARARTVFKYLVTRRGTPVSKELLAELFWPDSEPELARRSLHQAIYCLRQSLKRIAPELPLIQFADDCYQISPAVSVWVDSDEFVAAIGEARLSFAAGDLERAMGAYAVATDLVAGEFLGEERYEAWAEELRRGYKAMYFEALHRLAHYHYERGERATAILYGQRALAQESCDEEAHLLLMRAYVAQGLRHMAVRQYQLCVGALRSELGLTPGEELERFYRTVVDVENR